MGDEILKMTRADIVLAAAGSCCAQVRTAHLKAAGGIGPELDEDMTTSYIMTANGYKVGRAKWRAHACAHAHAPGCTLSAARGRWAGQRSLHELPRVPDEALASVSML